MPHFLKRLGSLTPRCRSADKVVPFGGAANECDDSVSSPRRKAAEGDEIMFGSPAVKTKMAFASSPAGSAKKHRLNQSDGNPHVMAASPPSSCKKPRISADQGAGVGLPSASPSTSKKPRLSPLNHTPRRAFSPPQNTKRKLYTDQSPGTDAMTPAASPLAPAASPPLPAMHSGMRNAANVCRPPVLPPGVGELPICPALSVSSQGPGAQSHRRELQFENATEVAEDPAMRASAPASVFSHRGGSAGIPSEAESQPKRPQTARPPARPAPAIGRAGSAMLTNAAKALTPRILMSPGRLMSPRRMMSPGRVMSPRRELPPASPRGDAAAQLGTAPGSQSQNVEAQPSKQNASASRAWLPSPRRTPRSTSRTEHVKENAASHITSNHNHGSTGVVFGTASTTEDPLSRQVTSDPVDALIRPMLSAVYGRPLADKEVSAANAACPEVPWLAQCAVLCPLPVGWRQSPASEGFPAIYTNDLTGEVTEQPPHLPRFSKLARLLLHAVTHPAEAGTAAAWVKVEIEDAYAETTRLQESWCRSIDPVSGSEFWHNPMSGKSSWESPAAASAYTAAVAERILTTEPFKAARAKEALRPKPPIEPWAKSESQPSASSRRKTSSTPKPRQAYVAPHNASHTDASDSCEEVPTQSSRRAPSLKRRPRQGQMEAATPRGSRSRTSDGYREATPPNSSRSRISDGYARAASPRVSRSRTAAPPSAVEPLSSDAVTALAGAAAALATAAATLSARGPPAEALPEQPTAALASAAAALSVRSVESCGSNFVPRLQPSAPSAPIQSMTDDDSAPSTPMAGRATQPTQAPSLPRSAIDTAASSSLPPLTEQASNIRTRPQHFHISDSDDSASESEIEAITAHAARVAAASSETDGKCESAVLVPFDSCDVLTAGSLQVEAEAAYAEDSQRSDAAKKSAAPRPKLSVPAIPIGEASAAKNRRANGYASGTHVAAAPCGA